MGTFEVRVLTSGHVAQLLLALQRVQQNDRQAETHQSHPDAEALPSPDRSQSCAVGVEEMPPLRLNRNQSQPLCSRKHTSPFSKCSPTPSPSPTTRSWCCLLALPVPPSLTCAMLTPGRIHYVLGHRAGPFEVASCGKNWHGQPHNCTAGGQQ